MKNNIKSNINNSRGSILVNRSILDWQHYSEPNYLLVFMTLLLVANHESRMWKGIKVERGETTISVDSLCKLCGLSRPTVIKVLKGLVETGEIKRTKMSRINTKSRILNYSKYQTVNPLLSKEFLPDSLHKQELYSNISHTNNIYKGENLKILDEMLAGGIALEQFCKNNHITREQFKELALDVINEWELTKTTHINESDVRRHLLSAIRIKVERKNLVTADVDSRLAPFIDDCKRLIADGYPVDRVREFYSYWTQPCNDHSGRMLFESVKAFDVETRFKKHFNQQQ